MKHTLKLLFGAALMAGAALPALAADVGISVQISQPGAYGRIDIGQFPQPQVVVQRPVVIVRQPVAAAPEPVYMWVPPGHRQNWRRHCGRYNACGVPVYFVQDRWYDQNVRRGNGRGRGDDRRDERRDDRRDGREDRRDDRRDHGNGHGRHD